MGWANLRTPICDLLGIAQPVVGAPMGGVAGPELAAAVSAAGGLGLLGHANTPLDDVRFQIRQTRQLTDRPFGVGLLFPTEAPGHSAEAPDDVDGQPAAGGLPAFLQPLRDLVPDIPTTGQPDVARPDRRFNLEDAHRRLDIVVEEGVPVLACGLGTPEAVVRRARGHGIRVLSLVGSRAAAVEVAQRGVDVLVAQGHEAGGHTGRTSTFVLVPQVVDAVRIPVVAAGGVMDGRGLSAALMLGASGVLLGTRLLATPEARTAKAHKERIVAMRDDETLVSRCYTGKPSRVLRNAFTDAWRGHEPEIRPMPWQWEMVAPLVEYAKAAGSLDVANWPTGQGAVLADAITPAGEVVRGMISQAARLLGGDPVDGREDAA